jgi:hypothetical protein
MAQMEIGSGMTGGSMLIDQLEAGFLQSGFRAVLIMHT